MSKPTEPDVIQEAYAAQVMRFWKNWLDQNLFDLIRQFRLSYLPPLMIYLAAGMSGLTGIVGTFFVKDYLGLSAEFLAALGFWVMLPWALKMPFGHLVDVFWRYKACLVYLGAALVTLSLLIMINLLSDQRTMSQVWPVENWYILASLLAPLGYMLQDIVADAMTVEAVARFDDRGGPLPEARIRLGHTTLQTLGRVSIISGTLLVGAANVYLFSGVESMSTLEKSAIYLNIYHWALLIPVISILGVLLAAYQRSEQEWRLAGQGYEFEDIERLLGRPDADQTTLNGWLLGGGLAFTLFATLMGLSDLNNNEEWVFAGSLAIVLFLIRHLTKTLEETQKKQLFGIAMVIFVFRAVPSTGAGETWWMIDELKFDQQFLAQLSLITSALTLLGMLMFRNYMAERPISAIFTMLTVALGLLYLPNIALYYGVQNWTAAVTGGVVDARFIALVDTALESPLGQVAMIPMLSWIANSAPKDLKATYFAVMAAFVNLALSLSQLLTKLLNQSFIVTREVRDLTTGSITVPADYSELGGLMWLVMILSLALPLSAIFIAKRHFLVE